MTSSDGISFRIEIQPSFLEGNNPPMPNHAWLRLKIQQVEGESLVRLGAGFMAAIDDLFATLPHVDSPSLKHCSAKKFQFIYDYAGDPELTSVVIKYLSEGIARLANSYNPSYSFIEQATSYVISDEDEEVDYVFLIDHQVEEGPSKWGTCWYTLCGAIINGPDMSQAERAHLDTALMRFCRNQPWISGGHIYTSGERSFVVSIECLAEDFAPGCLDTLMVYVSQALGQICYYLAHE